MNNKTPCFIFLGQEINNDFIFIYDILKYGQGFFDFDIYFNPTQKEIEEIDKYQEIIYIFKENE